LTKSFLSSCAGASVGLALAFVGLAASGASVVGAGRCCRIYICKCSMGRSLSINYNDMFKINKKVIFIAFVVCLFFLGLGVNDITHIYRDTHQLKFADLSPLIPYVISGSIFFYIFYIKKDRTTTSEN